MFPLAGLLPAAESLGFSRCASASRYRPDLMIWIIVRQELALKVYFDVPGEIFVTVPSG
jgi:hypothetical protein